jgi:hypothetical protein
LLHCSLGPPYTALPAPRHGSELEQPAKGPRHCRSLRSTWESRATSQRGRPRERLGHMTCLKGSKASRGSKGLGEWPWSLGLEKS